MEVLCYTSSQKQEYRPLMLNASNSPKHILPSLCTFAISCMLNRYLTFYKPPIQFVVFCAILSMSWLVGGYLAELLNTQITNLSSAQINELSEIPAKLGNQLKWINVFLLLLMLLLPAVLFSYLAYPKPSYYLGLRSPVKAYYIYWAILIMLLAIPFTSLLEEWSQLIPFIKASVDSDAGYDKLANSMLQGTHFQDLVFNILAMSLMPAMIEEIFFRGCLQQLLMNWMKSFPLLAILIVAIVFSAFHGQWGGFIPRLFLGLLLGMSYYYTNNLWVPIIMHFVNNFVTILMIYLFKSGQIQLDINQLPDTNIYLGLGSGMTVVIVLWLFYKHRSRFEIVAVDRNEEES